MVLLHPSPRYPPKGHRGHWVNRLSVAVLARRSPPWFELVFEVVELVVRMVAVEVESARFLQAVAERCPVLVVPLQNRSIREAMMHASRGQVRT